VNALRGARAALLKAAVDKKQAALGAPQKQFSKRRLMCVNAFSIAGSLDFCLWAKFKIRII
jgi:hypothetical protein